jgi:DNA-directed RNA polymerase delta subunit
MRTKAKVTSPEMALTRILDAFGQELIDASDEEIREVAKELGMDLQMKGSAAFAGLTFPAKWQLGDFFDVEAINRLIARRTADRSTKTVTSDAETKARRAARSQMLTDRKNGEK